MLKINNFFTIERVVSIAGKERAINFFAETQKIEMDGGMLIMNGSRRRTPGGVYLYLVKSDQHLEQEKIREIFVQDKRDNERNKKAELRSRLMSKSSRELADIQGYFFICLFI